MIKSKRAKERGVVMHDGNNVPFCWFKDRDNPDLLTSRIGGGSGFCTSAQIGDLATNDRNHSFEIITCEECIRAAVAVKLLTGSEE